MSLPSSPSFNIPIQKKSKRLSPNTKKILVILLIAIIVIALVIFLKAKRDNTSNIYDLFGDNFDITDLPQISEVKGIEGLRDYRTYNPCLFTIQGQDRPHMVYRVCNFSQCPGGKNPWDHNYREKTHTYTFIESPNGDLHQVKHDPISSSKCEQGCEDARSFICGDRLYLVCNRTMGENCRRQMIMMELSLSPFSSAENKSLTIKASEEQTLKKRAPKIDNLRPLSMRKLNAGFDNDRDQKNWMPLIMDDQIHFIYSINPHVILRYHGPIQERNSGFDPSDKNIPDEINCTIIAETTNPKVPSNLRGGGQIVAVRKWNPIFTTSAHNNHRYKPEDLYLGVAHTRDSNEEYSTYFYAFENIYPYRVKYLSTGFVFGERSSHSKRIQFASGLARINHSEATPDRPAGAYLYVTYGEHDCNGKLCVLREEDVLRSLHSVFPRK